MTFSVSCSTSMQPLCIRL